MLIILLPYYIVLCGVIELGILDGTDPLHHGIGWRLHDVDEGTYRTEGSMIF